MKHDDDTFATWMRHLWMEPRLKVFPSSGPVLGEDDVSMAIENIEEIVADIGRRGLEEDLNKLVRAWHARHGFPKASPSRSVSRPSPVLEPMFTDWPRPRRRSHPHLGCVRCGGTGVVYEGYSEETMRTPCDGPWVRP